jgi:2-iminoacetate synthase
MSAGSKTNPGGYAGEQDSLEQFSTSDERTPSEIAKMLTQKGYDPVWKDWDPSYDLYRPSEVQGVPFVTERTEEILSMAG